MTESPDPGSALDGPILGPWNGRKVPPLEIEIVRELGPEDIPLLSSPPTVGSVPATVQTLRASHHQLAQFLAQGRPDAEAGLITGYSLSRISILRADPTFRELMKYYQTQVEIKFADVLERMKIIGLSSLDEIQERLERDPGSFSHREMMELTELMLVKGRAIPGGTGGGSAGVAPVSVSVTFVDAGERPNLGPVIDGKVS